MDVTADSSEELDRLRRQLEKVTAERDELLGENRRLRHGYSTGSEESGKARLSPTGLEPGSSSATRKPASEGTAYPLDDFLKSVQSPAIHFLHLVVGKHIRSGIEIIKIAENITTGIPDSPVSFNQAIEDLFRNSDILRIIL